MPTFVIVEASAAAFEVAVRDAPDATVVRGFAPPFRSAGGVRVGDVGGADDAEAALVAAIAGEGLIVHATGAREVIDRLVDDLRRLGRVEHRVGEPAPALTLEPAARAILGLLAEGHSLGEAADLLGLSRRTADRRLADGRRALGVERTTEAITRARRLGWLGGGETAGR